MTRKAKVVIEVDMNARQVERALKLVNSNAKASLGRLGTIIKYGLTSAFIAAGYAGSRMFKEVSRQALNLNSQLESIKLGIETSLLIAGTGNTMTQGQRMGFAAARVEELRSAALETTLQFEELGGAYAKLLAPMIGAGIPMNKQVGMMVLMANAVAAITSESQAQLQLLQETTALLQGRFDPRSVLAMNLIRGDKERAAYRKAVKEGTQWEFLVPRLQNLASIGPRVAETAKGKESNIQQLYRVALTGASEGAFEQYHKLLDQLLKLVSTERFGEVLQQLMDFLEALLRFATEYIESGKLTNLLERLTATEAKVTPVPGDAAYAFGGMGGSVAGKSIAPNPLSMTVVEKLTKLLTSAESIEQDMSTGVKIDPSTL